MSKKIVLTGGGTAGACDPESGIAAISEAGRL